MADSRYEKYVVRKPAVFSSGFQQEVPEKVDIKGRVDTGPLIWVSRQLIEGSAVGVESGVISGDIIVGGGGGGKSTEKDLMSDNMMTFKMDARLIHNQMGGSSPDAGPQHASDLARGFAPSASPRRGSGGGFGAFLWKAIKGLVILSLFTGAVG